MSSPLESKVLRRRDYRFSSQFRIAEAYLSSDILFELIKQVYALVPEVLSGFNKVKDPYHNVDAMSGSIQHHYRVELVFCTVNFGCKPVVGINGLRCLGADVGAAD